MIALAACGRGGPTASSSGGQAGQVGVTFVVDVFRPTSGGKVTTADLRINCGPAAGETDCTETYNWTDVVTLIATPADGFTFGTWAGDCFTRGEVGGVFQCQLSTANNGGADKYVVAVFGEPGLTIHQNFTPKTGPDGKYLQGVETLHGQAFLKWIDLKGAPGPADDAAALADNTAAQIASGYFDCAACHGAAYDGLGIAPSCNSCHAANGGHTNWRNECTFCHGAPPSPSARPLDDPPFDHFAVPGTVPGACTPCHGGSVNSSGIISGGTHMNGIVEGSGHSKIPLASQHGPLFFTAVGDAAGGPTSCTSCHGSNYEGGLSGAAPSCNNCHRDAGWTQANLPPNLTSNWQTNCSFCHGSKEILDSNGDVLFNLRAGYIFAENQAWAGPPDAIDERLTGTDAPDRTGRHSIHVSDGGFAPAPKMECKACHPVPTNFNHISGAPNPNVMTADVQLTLEGAFPGLAAGELATRNAPFGTYNPVDGTCTTYCHGAYMNDGPPLVFDPDGNGPIPPVSIPLFKLPVNWTSGAAGTSISQCWQCHGSPPLSGSSTTGRTYASGAAPLDTRYCEPFFTGASCTNHAYHVKAQNSNNYDSCANCHFGSAATNAAGLHVNGKADLVPSLSAIGTKPVNFVWNPVNRSCNTVSCHTKSGTGSTNVTLW